MFLYFLILFGLYYEISCEEFHIFRNSALLHEVQLRQVFIDPKYFLRLKLLKPQREILHEFNELKLSRVTIEKRKKILKIFVETNFENTSGLVQWVPPDFKRSQDLLKKVQDNKLHQKLEEFNLAWLKYGRKLTKDVVTNPERYSFIPVPKPFFVSSNEEQEMGYWESFWIFQGLMACDMVESAKNLMENIFSIIDTLGYCPPYNRVYYRGRTSPPMLPFMMSSYLERTNDTDFLSKHITKMDSDLIMWIEQRTTLLESPFHTFFIMVEEWWPRIRPERYREDLLSLLNHTPRSSSLRKMLWTVDDSVLQTSVLLTAITEASARLLVPWLREYGHKAKARFFENVTREMNYTLQNLLRIGDCWRDLHIDEGYREESSSSLSPIWLGTSDLPCKSAKQKPVSSGPEAVLGSREQALRWLTDVCEVGVDNLVDIASAFHIVKKTDDISLDHPPELPYTRAKPLSWVFLVLAMMLFRYWMNSCYK